MGLLGQLNPLLKGPLEFATGKQFYTGRDLEDLYSPTGSVALEQLLMNSPLSRAYTTGRTLVDPRKDALAQLLNLGTGVKLSDVDVEKQRNVTAREVIDDLLRSRPGMRRFETLYAPADVLPTLAPEDIALLRLSKTLEQQAKKKNQRPGP